MTSEQEQPVRFELSAAPRGASVRLQFELWVGTYHELERLREEGGFKAKKDLLNNALTLLKWAMKHAEKGHVLAAVDRKSDKYFELQMPFLSHVARGLTMDWDAAAAAEVVKVELRSAS
jgi:hypothetical protein